jgi:hypothetical protein
MPFRNWPLLNSCPEMEDKAQLVLGQGLQLTLASKATRIAWVLIRLLKLTRKYACPQKSQLPVIKRHGLH